jgi:hypothetical protein
MTHLRRPTPVAYIENEPIAPTYKPGYTVNLVVEHRHTHEYAYPPRRLSRYEENRRRQAKAGCFMVPFWCATFALAAVVFAVDDADWIIKRGAAALALLFAAGAVSFMGLTIWYNLEAFVGALWMGEAWFDEQ